ncbi:unnamed protein product [Cylicostephanus goldi]|uniref:Uncharacterized protein n=1 Tax=Cylicostephanus goldi TaxID=71465 RepID=A0A3P6QUV5_CYLGO|nr:unnamed protein product [Cylicostephanus goldi]
MAGRDDYYGGGRGGGGGGYGGAGGGGYGGGPVRFLEFFRQNIKSTQRTAKKMSFRAPEQLCLEFVRTLFEGLFWNEESVENRILAMSCCGGAVKFRVVYVFLSKILPWRIFSVQKAVCCVRSLYSTRSL